MGYLLFIVLALFLVLPVVGVARNLGFIFGVALGVWAVPAVTGIGWGAVVFADAWLCSQWLVLDPAYMPGIGVLVAGVLMPGSLFSVAGRIYPHLAKVAAMAAYLVLFFCIGLSSPEPSRGEAPAERPPAGSASLLPGVAEMRNGVLGTRYLSPGGPVPMTHASL